MNIKIIGGIGAGIVVVIIAITLSPFSFYNDSPSYEDNSSTVTTEKITSVMSESNLGTSYLVTNNELKQILETYDISMSSTIKLDDLRDIWTYCNFFEGEAQKIVKYCTSTELRNADGEFLGNINTVGTSDEPKLMMAIIQVDPFLNQKQDAKTIFSVIIDHIVCDCWHSKDIQGSTLDSISDQHMEFHISGGKITSKSNIIPLEDKLIQLEMTTNTEGYLWKLFITS